MPSLDEKTFLTLASTRLEQAEMSEPAELTAAWGTEHGVKFGDTGARMNMEDT